MLLFVCLMYLAIFSLYRASVENLIKPLTELPRAKAEMPTSTFLPYFVRFSKENTAVRFFPPKYVFFYFLFFFI